MNYADLQQLVEDHLGRSDLSSWFQSFVASAETWLNYGSQETPPLRVREMETIATLTPVSGVVTLPADYLEYERVSEALSTRRTLDYVTPDQAERWYPDGAAGLAPNPAGGTGSPRSPSPCGLISKTGFGPKKGLASGGWYFDTRSRIVPLMLTPPALQTCS